MKPHVTEADRFWLLTLAMAALVIAGLIGLCAEWWGIPQRADALLGSITTGLLLFMREIVQTIRSYWQDEKTQRLTDQLNGTPTDPGEKP